MKKPLLILLFIFTLALLCSIVANATEYTVTDNASFNSAFESATDGDTIIIRSSISSTLNFGKSITYILDGDGIVWSARAGNSNTGKDVRVLSANGINTFKPSSSMWCNSYGLAVKNLSSTSWSLGSADGNGTLIFDLSIASNRLFYGVMLNKINLLSGAIVTNLYSTISSGDTSFIKCSTLNIYDGAKIFGNSSSEELIEATTLNMYGGEIYGNACTGIWSLITATNFNMFGGSIHGNYQPSPHGYYTSANNIQSVGTVTANAVRIYGGSIYDNYVGNGHDNGERGTVAGIGTRGDGSTLYMVADSIYSNKLVTYGKFGSFIKNSEGYYTCEIDESDIVNKNGESYSRQYNRFSVTTASHSVIFKNSDSSIADAFMMNGEKLVLSASGTTEATAPTDYDVWTNIKNGACNDAVIPSFFASGAYYGANHDIDEGKFIASYPDGFAKNGTTGNPCMLCDFVVEGDTLDPIFGASGYASSSNGVAGGFTIDTTALKAYNSSCETALKFGVIMFNPLYLGETVFDENMKLNASRGALTVDATSDEYSSIGFSIEGFTSEALKGLDLVIAFYVIDGESVEFIQKDYTGIDGAPITDTVTRGEYSLYTVDFTSVSAYTSTLEAQAYIVPEKKEN